MELKKNVQAARRKKRIKAQILGQVGTLRLSVYRSNKYVSAQIIDDKKGETLISVSEKEISVKDKTKTERAKLLGELLGEKAAKKKIDKVVFDRGSYKYHGRIKALAEGARKKGLIF